MNSKCSIFKEVHPDIVCMIKHSAEAAIKSEITEAIVDDLFTDFFNKKFLRVKKRRKMRSWFGYIPYGRMSWSYYTNLDFLMDLSEVLESDPVNYREIYGGSMNSDDLLCEVRALTDRLVNENE